MRAGPLLLAAALGLVPAPAGAAPRAASPAAPPPALFTHVALGPAVIEVLDPDASGFAFVELRGDPGRLRPAPWLAFESTMRDQFYGFGGFLDIPFAGRWVLTPLLGAAIYREHDGLGLGSQLEFRSTLELTAKVGAWRIGGSFGHFSNGHISRINPGTEVLKLVFVLPLPGARRAAP